MDRRSLTLVLAVAAAFAVAAPAVAAPGDTTLVNRSPLGSGDSWGDAYGNSLTDDGRIATFVSSDTRYVPNDGYDDDVFVRDIGQGTTAVFGGERGARDHDLSADGRWLVFVSSSRSIEQEADEDPDIYLANTATRETVNIGYLSRGEGRADRPGRPAISADGRRVVYQNGVGAIRLYDRASGTGRLLESDPRRECAHPVISDDGNVVAYTCIQPEGDPRPGGIYVWDLREPAPRRLGPGGDPRLSADGRFVVWGTDATASHGIPQDKAYDVVVTDRQTGQTDLVSYPGRDVGTSRPIVGGIPGAVSADGRYVAFTALLQENTEVTCCETPVVVDRETGHVELVARPDGNDGPVSIGWINDMTPDGRFVSFDANTPTLDAQKQGQEGCCWRTVYVRELPVRTPAQEPGPGTPGTPSTPAPGTPAPSTPQPGAQTATPNAATPNGAVPVIAGTPRTARASSSAATNGLTVRLAPTLTPDRRGRVPVTVRNATGRALTARVVLRSRTGRRIGTRTVRVRAHTSVQVRIRLTRAAHRALARERSAEIAVVVSRPGTMATTRATATLRPR